MLRSLNQLKGATIDATDGDVGKVSDFYFDDRQWVIRYLVVETGSWLFSRKVLITPMSVGTPQIESDVLQARLTRQQIEDSPDIDTERPVSRQHEQMLLAYYGYPNYWAGDITGRLGMAPGRVDGYLSQVINSEVEERQNRNDDEHLRSCHEVERYHIDAADGEIGHVEDLLVDENWAIRYLVINTRKWWFGHSVLIPPQWMDSIEWSSATVSVGLSRDAIREAPEYDTSRPPDAEFEQRLEQHYRQQSPGAGGGQA
ncbi:PRC-barrel domain-containing protein [Halopseudomonas sp.]|uniref:PRC-barrel domain-containing protein n=1 Tax=Halopseudomonas sp. TaxID=2901191 RepID=UPI00356A4956